MVRNKYFERCLSFLDGFYGIKVYENKVYVGGVNLFYKHHKTVEDLLTEIEDIIGVINI